MHFTVAQKKKLRQELLACLSSEKEIKKIILFGSFLNSNNPGDLDVAIIQDSSEAYLSLAMKYRKITRSISKRIPLDIVPLKSNNKDSWFFSEISAGEVIYER